MDDQTKYHIIPTVYLKGFIPNEESLIWVYQKDSNKIEAKKLDDGLFQKFNYYHDQKNNDPDKVEKLLLQLEDK
ncbi:MAG: DUF4238 domain-containing protein [Chitinophagales bacterium]|nr:DUF4238 domain-containing protein [Chitinophagales bacterium]MBP8754401.1 DUF4238 domain-containing protein [Chitinophagales bacterium]MBP9190554.1 DUF4238 domain-containing protein [Chitinophagales bacterium]MBP9549798.1 DUF4238 domain-containing protein [Chitinophagales bacterium]MBP9704032.1 DUF4238 domain-containing protein [Chitinophagales bacterium]